MYVSIQALTKSWLSYSYCFCFKYTLALNNNTKLKAAKTFCVAHDRSICIEDR